MESFREYNDGCSGLTWSSKTSSWLSGGSLGLFYALNTNQEDQGFEASEIAGDDAITAISLNPSEDLVAVGGNESVTLRCFPDAKIVTMSHVARRNLPVTNIQFTASGNNLLISSRDPGIVCFHVKTQREHTLVQTDNQGVRHFALSSKEKRLAFINESGGVAIFNIESKKGDEELSCSKMESYSVGLTSKETVRSINERGYKLAWFDESTLLVPSTKGSIVVLTPGSDATEKAWSESFLQGDSLSGLKHANTDVNLISFSPNRKFFASSDIEGNILIWKIDQENIGDSTVIRKISIGSALVDLVWGQAATDNYLLLVTCDKWQKINDVVSASEGHPASITSSTTKTASKNKQHEYETAATEVAPVATFEDDMSDEQFLALGDAMELEEEMKLQSQYVDEGPQTAPTQLMLEEEEFDVPTQAESHHPAPAPAPVAAPAAVATAPESVVVSSAVAATTSSSSANKNRKSKKEDDDDDAMFDDGPAPTVTNSASKSTKPTTSKVTALFDDEAESDSDADEDRNGKGAMMNEDEDEENQEPISVDQLLELANDLKKAGSGGFAQKVKLQGPFQPGTTKPDEKNRRYFCWNHVGNITFREDVIENRVEIRFTDTSTNRNEAFADRDGFVMGALGLDGAAFANEADEKPVYADAEQEFLANSDKANQKKGSTLLYHAFPGNHHLKGINESFRITLSDYEAIQCLAVGKGFIAAATSKRLLRVFTSTGLEVSVTWLKGPVVCMAAFDDLLAVVYHQGLPIDETYSLAMDLISIDWENGCQGREILSQFPVPLSTAPKTLLEWIGFDVDGKYVSILDNAGVLSCLIHSSLGWRWVPVLNITEVRKTIDHKYWPIAIKNSKLIYVLLNGENRPVVYPQPVVSLKSLRICQVSTRDGVEWNDQTKEKNSQLLWDSLRLSHYEHEISDLTRHNNGMLIGEELENFQQEMEKQQMVVDKGLLAAFQQACQTQHIPQAMNYALRLKSTKSFQAAIKIANHFGRTSVARSLDEMLQAKLALEQLQAQMQMGYYGGEGDAHVDASQSQQYSQAFGSEYQDMDASNGVGMLSRKASMKQQPSMAMSKVVSPDAATSSESQQDKPKKSLNPFALGGNNGSTPLKRGMEESKSSPSPKKPALNRTSTFAQNARSHRLNDKSII